jgi:thiol-disulfide isomerase/thioredoxin
VEEASENSGTNFRSIDKTGKKCIFIIQEDCMKTKLTFAAFAFIFSCGLFTGAVYAQSNRFAFPYAFSAGDIYGRPVTEKSLGEKELFFVHYWATWCPPCIKEIPDLAAIAKRYGDRVGFIVLLDDYQDNKAAAIRLAENAGIPFIMVNAKHSNFRTLLQMVQSGYVPTTILIGRDGKVIGEQIVGAYGLGYANFIDKALAR